MALIDEVATAFPPPDGYTVNFERPQRKGILAIYCAIGVGSLLAFLFLAQRIYVKLRLRRTSLDVEDVFVVGAWVFSVALQAIQGRTFAAGVAGVHGWEIFVDQYNLFMVMMMCVSVLYALATCFAKLSLLFFYHRLCPVTLIVWAVRVVMGITVGYSVGIPLSLMLVCDPIARSWDITITRGHCLNRRPLYIAGAVISVTTDVVLLLMPLFVMWRLRINPNTKVGLMLLFIVGFIALVTSVIRLVILFPILGDRDVTWSVACLEVWISVETNLLVICASLTTVRAFLFHVAPRLIWDSGVSNSGMCKPEQPNLSLVTWGQGSPKKKYLKFGNCEYALRSMDTATSSSETQQA